MYHAHYDFFSGQFLQGVTQCFYGTIKVTLDDQVQLFKVTQCKTASDFIQRNMFLGTDTLFTDDLCTAGSHFFRFGFIFKHSEFLTGLWSTVQTQYLYRCRWSGRFYALTAFIEHRLDLTEVRS